MTCRGNDKDFALRDGNKLYFFVHGLRITGDGNGVVDRGDRGDDQDASAFLGIPGKIKSVHWTDDPLCRDLRFEQNGDQIRIDFTHFPYGSDLVVRVAVAELDEAL